MLPSCAIGKEPACQSRRPKRCRFYPWVGKIPWRRAWQPTPVFLPGESRGQRSLTGYSPWGHKELDMTEQQQQPPLYGCAPVCLFAQSCPTVCNPMDCSPPGFSVHGILQARILEWVAVSFSRGSDPWIKPVSPTLQADSLLSEPPGSLLLGNGD